MVCMICCIENSSRSLLKFLDFKETTKPEVHLISPYETRYQEGPQETLPDSYIAISFAPSEMV